MPSFKSIRDYVYDRRRGLATALGLAGGIYLLGQYVGGRLEEIRDKVIQDRAARENLRRRFQQNQEDCTFHVLALLPTLGNQILEDMDVEKLTLTIQQSRSSVGSQLSVSNDSAASEASLEVNVSPLSPTASSLPLQGQASPRRDPSIPRPPHPHDSVSYPEIIVEPGSSNTHELDTSALAESSLSWVEQFMSSQPHPPPHERNEEDGSPSSRGGLLSDSVTSASMVTSESDEGRSALMVDSVHLSVPPSERIPPKTKAELWKEVKILTFTRALTLIYSLVLLSLETHVQLNLIGRHKYVESVISMEREEKLRERSTLEASIGSLFWGASEDELGGGGLSGRDAESDGDGEGGERLGGRQEEFSEETERKYLTMSWWLLNVGWKELGVRVRSAVERSVESVSLKGLVGLEEIERIISDIRRRVEFDQHPSTPSKFTASILPLTTADEELVLLQGGIPTYQAHVDISLREILDENLDIVARSHDFDVVFAACVDRATKALLDSLREGIFHEERVVEVFEGGIGEGGGEGKKVKLASVLPCIARWSHLAVNGNPNEVVEGIAQLREVAALSAIIYSSYEERFR